ncbi:MAG: hypothetical protein NTY35_12065 [Planctomycetota bacterium]|nr:hypothetical protein [Planctomycetota bacterium]
MSTTTTLSFFATACLGLATFQGNAARDAEASVDALAKDVAALQKVVDSQAKDLADAKNLAEKGAKYAAEQAKAAGAMLETLDASEKAGFTFGINPDSRVVLLRGWREALNAAQREVPALPPAPPASKTTAQVR